jgi:hypothetical protein
MGKTVGQKSAALINNPFNLQNFLNGTTCNFSLVVGRHNPRMCADPKKSGRHPFAAFRKSFVEIREMCQPVERKECKFLKIISMRQRNSVFRKVMLGKVQRFFHFSRVEMRKNRQNLSNVTVVLGDRVCGGRKGWPPYRVQPGEDEVPEGLHHREPQALPHQLCHRPSNSQG